MKPLLRSTCCLVACVGLSAANVSAQDDWERQFVSDSESLSAELQLPKNSTGAPAAGKRVAVTPPEYVGTDVHHMLYLPDNWSRESASRAKLPVMVEYTGNHFPKAGSTGKIEDAGLGYGISKGRFIWVTLPFVSPDHQSNAITWWGDEQATIDYAVTNVPRICEEFGGDPNAVFICGFSRGAIAANYIGLHNDQIAKLWRGFITHDHYDGVLSWGTKWGSPLEAYRATSAKRLSRLAGRPSLICQAKSTKKIADYLKPVVGLDTFTFVDVDPAKILGKFPNQLAIHPHTDRWLLKDSAERRQVWKWLHNVLTHTPQQPKPEPQSKPARQLIWEGVKDHQSKSAITVHLPENGNGAAVVICPGGGYGGLVTGPEGHGIAQWLNQHGIAGIVLEYELPKGRADTPLRDAQRALRLVRSRAKTWNINPERIGVMGFSAGGHLAATAGTHFDAGVPAAPDPIEQASCRPDFMVLVYPVITMGEKTHQGSKRNLLGTEPSNELVDLYSNEKQVTARTPPAYLTHAKDDRAVVSDNSQMFHDALRKHNVATQYLELPSGGHGLNGYRGPMWDAWQTGALRWLAAQKFIPGT